MQGELGTRLLAVERGIEVFGVDALNALDRAGRLQQQLREVGYILGGAAGLITVTVKDAGTGATISGASVTATDGVITIFTGTTDGSGVCKIPIYSTDALNVMGSASGYTSSTVPIMPVLDDTNTLTINLTAGLACQHCTLPKRNLSGTLVYWTDSAKTISNSRALTLTWSSGPSNWQVLGGFNLTDYFVTGHPGITTSHVLLLSCAGASLSEQLAHQVWTSGFGTLLESTTYTFTPTNADSKITCSPFSLHVGGAVAAMSDDTIDFS